MSQTPDAESSDERNAFTCGTLLASLCLPGLSKKKPEESGKSRQPTASEQDQPPEQEPPKVPSRTASLEKLECSSLYSGSNIVFDFLAVEPGEGDARAIHGYCPSPCFDLPVELIRTGERCGVEDAPVTSAFVFDGYRDGPALKKMASCLASAGVPDGTAVRPTHLVRYLSASDSGLPVRPPVTSFGPAKG
ncbi:unnamed protein product [Alopecurus aequalis]